MYGNIRQWFPKFRSGGVNPAYDLSGESGWLHCYSFAKRVSTYNGFCIKVIRDSDSEEMDIGFDSNGVINISDLNDFCNGTVGRILIFYDQVGGNNLLGQGAYPRVYESGSFLERAVNANDSYFNFSTPFDPEQNFSLIVAITSTTSGNYFIRRGNSNRGILMTLGGITYYGVATYGFPNSITFSGDGYHCTFHTLNTSIKGSSWYRGFNDDLLYDRGTNSSLGTFRDTTQDSRLGPLTDNNGTPTTLNSFSFCDYYLFSEDKTGNTNIFDKRFNP